MPLITRANCQSENFTITNHNIYYTKKQLISHQHTPVPMNKIKPKSLKKKKKGKILIKLKLQPITVRKNQIELVLKNKERESLIHFILVILERERERERERVRVKKREKLLKWNTLRKYRSKEAWRLRLRQWQAISNEGRVTSDLQSTSEQQDQSSMQRCALDWTNLRWHDRSPTTSEQRDQSSFVGLSLRRKVLLYWRFCL